MVSIRTEMCPHEKQTMHISLVWHVKIYTLSMQWRNGKIKNRETKSITIEWLNNHQTEKPNEAFNQIYAVVHLICRVELSMKWTALKVVV